MKKTVDKRTKALLEERAKRRKQRELFALEKILFPKQLAAAQDPAKGKAYLTTRRAGKTTCFAGISIDSALNHPNCQIPYITLTRPQAKRNFWPALRDLNARFNLGMKFNNHEGIARLPNDSEIFIVGADDEAEIHKLRGGAFPDVFIDEAQNFRPLVTDLIQDVLEPTLMDYDGTLHLGGTPNTACYGLFYEITTRHAKDGQGYSVHRWSVRDNPYIKKGQVMEPGGWQHNLFIDTFFARILARNHWTQKTPRFRCEYLGEWAKDETNSPFTVRDHAIIAGFDWAAFDDWSYALGIDLGYSSPSAFVVVAWSLKARVAIVVSTYEEKGLTVSGIAAETRRMLEQWPITSVMVDPGGLGGTIIDELNQTYGLPCQAVQKGPGYKLAAIRTLDADLQNGQLKLLVDNEKLIQDMRIIQWDEKKRDFDRYAPDHLADALIYAYTACKHRHGESEYDSPPPGSDKWMEQEEERMLNEAFASLEEDPRWAGMGLPDWAR